MGNTRQCAFVSYKSNGNARTASSVCTPGLCTKSTFDTDTSKPLKVDLIARYAYDFYKAY